MGDFDNVIRQGDSATSRLSLSSRIFSTRVGGKRVRDFIIIDRSEIEGKSNLVNCRLDRISATVWPWYVLGSVQRSYWSAMKAE